jgi:hypothetical protein
MPLPQCPLCFGPLEVRDVAPCAECGGDPRELEHLREGRHTYQLLRVLDGVEMVLCNFCMVDFGSWDPTYFGLAPGTRIGFEKMQFLRDVGASDRGKDEFCPACGHRLAFLREVAACRERHAG